MTLTLIQIYCKGWELYFLNSKKVDNHDYSLLIDAQYAGYYIYIFKLFLFSSFGEAPTCHWCTVAGHTCQIW